MIQQMGGKLAAGGFDMTSCSAVSPLHHICIQMPHEKETSCTVSLYKASADLGVLLHVRGESVLLLTVNGQSLENGRPYLQKYICLG